jgi:hypothetical protein
MVGAWKAARLGRAAGTAALLLVASAATGCAKYVPVDLAAVQPDDDVRVRFTEEGTMRLAPAFGRIIQQVEANVEARGADSMTVSLWIGRNHPGTPFANVRQVVPVGNRDVLSLHRREFDVGRSVLTGVVVAGTLVLVARQVGFREDPNPPDPGNGGTPPPDRSILLTLFRLPLN